MHINIHKSVLLKPLEQVAKALSSKTTIPILSGIFIQANSNGLTLIAGEIGMTIKIEIPLSHCEIIRHGSIVLPAKIVNVISKADGQIAIETEGLQATVKSGRTKFELAGMVGDEYPEFEKVSGEVVSLNGGDLKMMIAKTLFATSTDQSLPILSGALIEVTEDRIKFTACDRHRLAVIDYKIGSGFPLTTVVGKKSLVELGKIISDDDEVSLSLELNKVMVRVKNVTLVSTTLEGSYPDTTKLVPNRFSTEVTVSTEQLLQALGSAMVVAEEAGKTKLIKLIISDEIEIQSKVENKNVSASLAFDKIAGDGLSISLNSQFLLDALSSINSKMTILHFNTNMQPVIITGEDELGNFQLILPYKTTA
jgi:DNA polymerase-3 subunit beta